LGNDPFVIAECLARPVLSERMTSGLLVTQTKTGLLRSDILAAATANYYALPTISDGAARCTDHTWTAASRIHAHAARDSHRALWTGSEMIVWGGFGGPSIGYLNTGGRYTPSIDSWVATSTIGAPDARDSNTALWTGIEMIIWGGSVVGPPENTG